MRRRLPPLLVALAALLAAAPADGADYVGLGDSYSSGTGTAGSYADNCQRTAAAYPSLLDPQLPGSGVNLSCSGARTEHVTTDAQGPGNPSPQIDLPGGLGAGTDVVTLQIGGNDVGFVDTLVACGNPFGDCSAAIAEAEQKAQTELPPKLNATYDAVRARAPNATILVVGYPRIFRPNQSCNVFFSAQEVNDLNAAADLLSSLIKGLAQARDLAYADAIPAFIGHGACDSVEWINGLSFSQVANSYHPKAAGHSSGYAPLALATLQGIPETAIDSKPPDPSNDDSPAFGFSAAPAAAGFQCRLDAGAFAPCSSPHQLGGLAEGLHTLSVRGVSPEGNVDQFPASYTWTVDTTAPGVAIDSGPSGTVGSAAASFELSSDDPGAQLDCRLDSGPFTPCASPASLSGLAEGPHSFTVRATDAAGNASTATRSWSVDTIAPRALVLSGPGDPTASGEASFEFSVDEPAATAECLLDTPDPGPEDFEPCSSPQAYSGLAEGAYSFRVRVTDAAGNTGVSEPYEWTVDTTASTVAIIAGPPPLSSDPVPSFSFTVDDPSATVECRIDAGGFAPCASGQSFPAVADGPHTFTVRATDAASNVAADSYGWTVDTVAPSAAIDSGPPAVTAATAAELGFSSPDATASFECRLDSSSPGDFAPCTPPRSYGSLGDGPHAFEVRAVDPAGNAGTPASHAWTVDTAPPSAAITAKPPAASPVSTASFAFSADEPGSSFECRLDSGAFAPCSSPQPYAGLADGPHAFELRATDPAGNTGAVVSHAWSIDTTPPTVSFDSGPPAVSTSASASFSFHASEVGSSFECRLDSGAPEDFFACSSPRSYAGLADGPHTLEVRARDPLGNLGPVAAYSWNSDILTPAVAIASGPSGATRSTAASFSFAATEPGDFACRLDSAAEGDFAGCESPQAYSGLAQGPHRFEVRVTDAGGRRSTDSRSWTVDTVAPAVSIDPGSGPAPLTNSSAATFAFTVSGGGPPRCRLDGGPFAPCSSPHGYTGLGEGRHTFTVRSSDAAGNVGARSRSWRVDRTPPRPAVTAGPPSLTAATSASFAFSADDPGAAFSCSLDGSPFAPCASPLALSGLAEGDHGLRLRASDRAGNMGETAYNWRVQAPAAGAPGQASVTAPKAKRNCKQIRSKKKRRKCFKQKCKKIKSKGKRKKCLEKQGRKK